jgi:hypothetical protein
MIDWLPPRRHLAPPGAMGPPRTPPLRVAGPGNLAWKPLAADSTPVTPVFAVDTARLEHAIRCTSDLPDPNDAIQRLDALWQTVDALATLAESRMRILLTRVRAPEIAPEPRWLAKASKELSDTETPDLGAPNRAAVDSARRLVRALVATHPEQRADLEPAPAGSVLVKWRNSSLRWLVSAPKLPWPGVSVRAYFRADPALPKLEQETSHYAPQILERATKNL